MPEVTAAQGFFTLEKPHEAQNPGNSLLFSLLAANYTWRPVSLGCIRHQFFPYKTNPLSAFLEFAAGLMLPERAANIAQLLGEFGHHVGNLFWL